ncbi:MAG: MbnP family protein [Ferruginibacter sp.]
MNKLLFFTAFIIFSLQAFSQKKTVKKTGILFTNIANGKRVVPADSKYSNAFGESYTITKFRYYISNLHFITDKPSAAVKNTFLADAAKENKFILKKPAGKIKGISFLLGVDSLLNSSGAQSGALDPLNDMFWTWNSGYVMFKLEGKSDSSTADLQRIEQHIGGYKDPYKTMRQIDLYFKKGMPKNVIVQLDLDKYWNGIHKIHIARSPLITSIGEDAVRSADNFVGMFSVIE